MSCGVPSYAQATQVVSDGTVGTLVNGSSTECTGGTCSVTGGIQVGTSLFHSFEQFSLQAGDEVSFSNSGINTIFSRVTGGSSSIDGTIGTATSTPTDIFLLNPQGILFGPNAVLNISGSFLATTADNITFDNGAIFSASNPTQLGGLLSISTTIGLQYGTNPRTIEVQGPGHQLGLTPFFEFDRTNRPVGLEVNVGETLALLGGPITLDGGNVTAFGGHVELASVGNNSTIGIQSTDAAWAFDYTQATDLNDISFANAASLDVSAGDGGSVGVRAQQLSLTENSVIVANLQGTGTSGGLNIQADGILIQGTAAPISGGFYSDIEIPATGQGGDINVQTQELSILNQGRLSTFTYANGNTGDINVQADQLTMTGSSFIVSSGFPLSSGDAGDVTVTADAIDFREGAQIATSHLGVGATGTIRVNAETLFFQGISTDGRTQSGLVAQGFGSAGGEVIVNANEIQLVDGGVISAATFSDFPGGNVTIDASILEATGGATGGGPSGVFSDVLPPANGDGGNLLLMVDQLRLADGANIAVGTLGAGDAGNMIINADTIDLKGTSPNGRTGLFASTILGTGNGGNIDLDARQINIQDGATISASGFQSLGLLPPGQGSPGNIQITAENLALLNDASIAADTIALDHELGNIFLNLNTLTLQQGSRISTNAQGSSTGGNITIDAIAIVAKDNSDISANAQQGIGGRIVINSGIILGTEFRDQITTESDITASSELGPTFSGTVELNTPEYEADNGLIVLPTSTVDNSQQVSRQCNLNNENSFVVSSRGGSPTVLDAVLRTETIWTDSRLSPEQTSASDITTTQESGDTYFSDVNPTQSGPMLTKSGLIEAQEIFINNGHVRLVATSSRKQADNVTIACPGRV